MSLTLLLFILILFQQSIYADPPEGAGDDTEITNNCGMVLYYQPKSKGYCTEISLVDGYCCFVKIKDHGTACIRQGEIDEDNKNKITDEMRKAVNRLKDPSISGNVVIESVQCKGYYMAFYALSLLLLAVML